MELILSILIHTPWWVWLILVWVLYVGIRSLKDRTIYWPMLMAVPAIIMGFKLKTFFDGNWWLSLGSLAVGLLWGGKHALQTSIKVFKATKSIGIPGSYSTLIAAGLFFVLKYVFGYLESSGADLAIEYAAAETVGSGTISGYLLGKAGTLLYRYFKHKA